VNCRRADLDGKSVQDLHKNYVLCANHFENSQFLNGLQNRLKWNAVPTVFNVSKLLYVIEYSLGIYQNAICHDSSFFKSSQILELLGMPLCP
jgi:hypothetical protein